MIIAACYNTRVEHRVSLFGWVPRTDSACTLRFFSHQSATYRSLGAVMIFMLWLYFFGLAYLIGGEINGVIEHAREQSGLRRAKIRDMS